MKSLPEMAPLEAVQLEGASVSCWACAGGVVALCVGWPQPWRNHTWYVPPLEFAPIADWLEASGHRDSERIQRVLRDAERLHQAWTG